MTLFTRATYIKCQGSNPYSYFGNIMLFCFLCCVLVLLFLFQDRMRFRCAECNDLFPNFVPEFLLFTLSTTPNAVSDFLFASFHTSVARDPWLLFCSDLLSGFSWRFQHFRFLLVFAFCFF